MEQHVEYATYLLKNHQALRRDIEVLKMGLAFDASNLSDEAGTGIGGLDTICRAVKKRMDNVPNSQIEQMVLTSEIELKRLDVAVDALPDRQKNILRDIYYHNLTWTQVSMRRYVSPNTLNRYRKKGIEAVGRALCGYGLAVKVHEDASALTG